MDVQTAVSGTIVSALIDLKNRAVRRRSYRKTVAELKALSLRELQDLGLTRGSIESIARKSVYGV
ncbi:MAG: DUF1127 domain-containing protein [Rhodobacteraceae bacterium]|nr:DUF1127 domain-containing protein [Paracoccaceae bacterium]